MQGACCLRSRRSRLLLGADFLLDGAEDVVDGAGAFDGVIEAFAGVVVHQGAGGIVIYLEAFADGFGVVVAAA